MLEAKAFTLPGSEENGGLLNTLVRYRLANADGGSTTPFDRPRVWLSLLCLHGAAYHKEAWLPVLERLFDLQRATPTSAFAVMEAWCMDAPNHGRAAILNERRLLEYPNGLTGAQCAREVNVFLKSGLIASGCSVVAIGHSASACILVQSTADYAVNQLPFSSLIMVEPPMMTPERLQEAIKEGVVLLRAIDIARVRKDVWPSRAVAKEWFAKRLPWNRWDPRTLDLYIEHGLRDLPTATYPDLKEGVTLTAPREHEAGAYSDYDNAHIGMERLKEICPAMPVHCVFGEINDMVPVETQADMVDERVGRRMRSVVRVSGAGHLVLQEKPRELALAIWGILHEDYAQRVHPVIAHL
ncbi:alpha/beta-hydrolase [Trametes punicea]|nr:alpha/beta-hydrolase [Trametes punicea]